MVCGSLKLLEGILTCRVQREATFHHSYNECISLHVRNMLADAHTYSSSKVSQIPSWIPYLFLNAWGVQLCKSYICSHFKLFLVL